MSDVTSFQRLLASTSSAANFDEVLAGLKILQEVVAVQDLTDRDTEETDKREEQESGRSNIQETIETLRSKIKVLQRQSEFSDAQLSRFEADADARMMETIDSVLSNTIIDYQSAYQTTMIYTMDWFSRVLLSENGKVTLANLLLQYITPYCNSNLMTLQKIAERDEIVMQRIKLPTAA